MKFFKRTDIIVIAAILLISLISWIAYEIYTDDKAIKAEIYYYSELVKTVRLDKPKNYKFSIDQNPNVIFQVDENGGIAFISSDCPDKVCVKTGRLYRIG
ncbi:MAG TPA: NusG domain II-containing protein, partial [Anaerovoracaceae bacterium]|nr:NusG domain II-containing protein [Anaerovoracaceae bacterium]